MVFLYASNICDHLNFSKPSKNLGRLDWFYTSQFVQQWKKLKIIVIEIVKSKEMHTVRFFAVYRRFRPVK